VTKAVKQASTEDRLLGGRVRLVQPAAGYRVAIDPVLLAAAVPARKGERVLDIGTGSGAAALCLAARVEGCRVLGLERDGTLARLARESVRLNAFDDSVEIVSGDLAHPPAVLAAGSFDRVMANPPFLEAGTAERRGSRARAAAHVEGAEGLDSWVAFALRMARPAGTATFIYRADRLDDLLAALHGQWGGIVVCPLWPKRGRPAKRVIVQAVRGSRAPLILTPGLVLHAKSGAYTRDADAILSGGSALALVGVPCVGKRRRRD
jgi:tRNA1(Val) A37 N6-methylase TrmN6